MNKEIILSNLREAHEELTDTIKDLETKPDYDFGDFMVPMMHIFHHLNFAWNIRDVDTEKYANLSDADYKKWEKYPKDFDQYFE